MKSKPTFTNLHSNLSLTRKITLLSTVIALFPITAFLCLTIAPTLTDTASAAPVSSEANVEIEEVLSIRIVEQNPSTGEWDIDTDTIHARTRHGSFGHSTVKVIASTNAPGGYTLSLNDADNDTFLTSATVVDTIPTLSSDSNLADLDDSTDQFPENKWGYNWVKDGATANYTFSPIPTASASASAKQKDSTSNVGVGRYAFTLGVKVAEDTSAATYTDQILFTLVGNPAPSAPLFFRTTYMDQFTTAICNSVDTPASNITAVTHPSGSNYASGGTIVPSTTIIDRRDGEVYTIRKLADGNCWMTENLRLGKNGQVVLNSDNSNLASGRTFTVPAATTEAGVKWGNQDAYPFVFYRDSNPGAVSATVKPDGITPDSPSALYNWYTATAGARDASGNSLMTEATGLAVDSVCPKNWRLPINGGINTDLSYGKLVYTYTDATGNSSADTETSSAQATINENRIKKLLAEPTRFVYSDYYNYGGTLLSRPVGNYWSASVNSADNAYYLYFNTNGTTRSLYPQGDSNKGYGFAVRCVAQ